MKNVEKDRNSSTTLSVIHDGGNFIAWACIAARGTGSLLLLMKGPMMKCRMNFEVYRPILYAHIQPNSVQVIGVTEYPI